MSTAYVMADHPQPEWINPGIWGVLGAVITGGLAYLGIRFNAKKNPAIDPQAEINDGFLGVLNELRTEVRAAKRERNALWDTITEERAAWAAERLVWEGERQTYRDEIAQLQQISRSFENALLRAEAGEPTYLRPRKPVTPPADDVLIVEATLRQDGLGDD